MVAEIVRAESVRLADTIAALPDAISTIIVSPTARPNPSATPAAMPGLAAGRITRPMVCQRRSEEHTSELQSQSHISYAVFCLKKKNTQAQQHPDSTHTTTSTPT